MNVVCKNSYTKQETPAEVETPVGTTPTRTSLSIGNKKSDPTTEDSVIIFESGTADSAPVADEPAVAEGAVSADEPIIAEADNVDSEEVAPVDEPMTREPEDTVEGDLKVVAEEDATTPSKSKKAKKQVSSKSTSKSSKLAGKQKKAKKDKPVADRKQVAEPKQAKKTKSAKPAKAPKEPVFAEPAEPVSNSRGFSILAFLLIGGLVAAAAYFGVQFSISQFISTISRELIF